MTPPEVWMQYGIAGLALILMYSINQGLRNDIVHLLEEIRDQLKK